jgi:hypothetical protein
VILIGVNNDFLYLLLESDHFSSSLKLGTKKKFGIKIDNILNFLKLKGPHIYNQESLGIKMHISHKLC